MIKYLAGIFDSEGYVRIRKTKSGKKYGYTPEVKVYMTNEDIVKEFSKLYNLKIKKDNRGLNKKKVYYINLGVKLLRSTSFIDDFLPFLNEKRLQLTEVKNLLEGIKDKEECYQDYMKYKTYFDHPINKEEISWEYLAGLIDGDGWLSMFKAAKKFDTSLYNKYSVGIQQRYKPIIDYFSTLGGGNVHKNKIYDYTNHRQTYSWQGTTKDILHLLINIEPFLIEKQEKCKIMIEYVNKLEEFENYSTSLLDKFKE